jgi:hypothetical protein
MSTAMHSGHDDPVAVRRAAPRDAPTKQRGPLDVGSTTDPGSEQSVRCARCETRAVSQSHIGELIGDVRGCLRFAEPDLGMREDVLADPHDAIGLTVDLRTDTDLKLFLGHGAWSLSIGCRT